MDRGSVNWESCNSLLQFPICIRGILTGGTVMYTSMGIGTSNGTGYRVLPRV